MVDHRSGTTDITLQYNALNRVTNMVDAAGTTKYTYKSGGLLETEDGPWTSDTVTNLYNSARLKSGLILAQPTGTWTNGFTYDGAHRMSNVVFSGGTFTYSYKGPGSLVTNLALPNTAKITNAYDNVARLTGTYLVNSGGTVLNKHEYLYNAGNQPIQHTRTDSSYYTNNYDDIGQLKVADSTTAIEDRNYGYDAAWNINKRTNNATVYTFTVDSKNELTNFNGTTYTYDSNGNLTNPGFLVYAYDAENQLTSVTYPNTQKTDFLYDGRGRLRKRVESIWTNSTWQATSETRYIYDGMRVIQERNSANTPTVVYTRGNDLSGSLERAAGIGGLLARSHAYSGGSWGTHNYYHADGGGNITMLVDASQVTVASYRYDPYGNTISSSGGLAATNVYQFSSKELIVNWGLYYYGYRFYDPNTQRWLNRDPLSEYGGYNLYRFNYNSALNYIDPDGLTPQGAGIGAGIGGFIGAGIGGLVGAAGGTLVLPGVGTVAGAAELGTVGLAAGTALGAAAGNAVSDIWNLVRGRPKPFPTRCEAQRGAGSSLPTTGKPGSSAASDNGDGTGTIRNYGPDGKAQTDYDIGHDHTGAGDPHAHDWDWTGPKPVRQPPRPLNPGE